MAQHTLILVLNGDGGGFGLKGVRMRKYAISKCLRATAESVPCRPPFDSLLILWGTPLARPVETGGFHHVLHQCLLKRTSCTNHANRACLTTILCKVLHPCGFRSFGSVQYAHTPALRSKHEIILLQTCSRPSPRIGAQAKRGSGRHAAALYDRMPTLHSSTNSSGPK